MATLNFVLILSITKLEICSNSQLVIGKIQGEYEAKDEHMARYLSNVRANLDRLSK